VVGFPVHLPFIMAQHIIEWLAALFGILGSWMLAQNKPWSRWAWPIWVVSNVMWVGFALYIHAWGVLMQNGVFMAVNLYAVRRWFFAAAANEAEVSQG
jgi:hypothetical protein